MQIVDEAKEQATVESERIIIAAKAEVEQESNRAKEELRGQVAALALAGAEKILGQTIDMKAHNQLVNELATDL